MEKMVKKSKDMRAELAKETTPETIDKVMASYFKLNGAVKLFGQQQGSNLKEMEAYVENTKEIETAFIKGKEKIKSLQSETKTLGKLSKQAGTPEAVIVFLEKQEANILRVLYANKYDIISVFNPKMFDTLKKEVDEYNQAEEEKQEKRELEKIEREKRER